MPSFLYPSNPITTSPSIPVAAVPGTLPLHPPEVPPTRPATSATARPRPAGARERTRNHHRARKRLTCGSQQSPAVHDSPHRHPHCCRSRSRAGPDGRGLQMRTLGPKPPAPFRYVALAHAGTGSGRLTRLNLCREIEAERHRDRRMMSSRCHYGTRRLRRHDCMACMSPAGRKYTPLRVWPCLPSPGLRRES